MNLHADLKKIARSSYWQELYRATKECHGIHLFNNVNNFSGLQKLHLYNLRMYDMLYDELYQLKWENLSEEVINDDDRLEAFLYWRRKQQEKQLREYNKEQRKGSKKSNQKGQRFKIFTGPKNKQDGDT